MKVTASEVHGDISPQGVIPAPDGVRVGYPGHLGGYSRECALKLYANDAQLKAYAGIDEVIRALAEGEVDTAVVPWSRGHQRPVRATHQALAFWTGICVERRVFRAISLSLLGPPGASPSAVRRIVAREALFEECDAWLQQNLPEVERVECLHMADALDMAESRSDTLAIAPPSLARRPGLVCLAQRIEDDPGRVAQFAVLRRDHARVRGQCFSCDTTVDEGQGNAVLSGTSEPTG